MSGKFVEYAELAVKRDSESSYPLGYRTSADDVLRHFGTRLDGKTAVITGGTTGLGKETARALASVGARVFITARSQEKADAALAELRAATGSADVHAVVLELASLASVRAAAAELLAKVDKLHLLVLNAGIMACPQWETEDGLEMQFGADLPTTLFLRRAALTHAPDRREPRGAPPAGHSAGPRPGGRRARSRRRPVQLRAPDG